MEMQEIRKNLKKDLDKYRYEHTKGVMYTAGCLAMANNYDVEKAMLAGLLHDCAKCHSTEEKIALCERHDILKSKWKIRDYYMRRQEWLLRKKNMISMIQRFCML